MVRTKFVALLLGPSGVGMLALYTSITGMVATLAGMGINSSGVRQIARAYAEEDSKIIAKSVITLRRTVWLTGTLGAIGMALLAWPLSNLSFGSSKEALNLALLGSTILLGSIAAGQMCLLQGTRQISQLGLVSIFGALNSTLISIPCYYFFGQRGIVPSLILGALAGVLTSWWYARRISILSISMSWEDTSKEAKELLKLGFPLMLSALATMAGVYVVQILLIRRFGLDAFGVYQAAYSLSGILAGFVLSAMGTDYYPRLASVSDAPDKMRREINSQTEIALLLATPGLAATLIFAPLIIKGFYSEHFNGSVEILRWTVFGVLGRVVAWPMGYLVLVKAKGFLYLTLETSSNVLYIILIIICTQLFGIKGAGIAFVILYISYTVLMYIVCTYLNGKIWTSGVFLQIIGSGGALLCVAFVVTAIDNDLTRLMMSLFMLVSICIYSIHRLAVRANFSLAGIIARFSTKNK